MRDQRWCWANPRPHYNPLKEFPLAQKARGASPGLLAGVGVGEAGDKPSAMGACAPSPVATKMRFMLPTEAASRKTWSWVLLSFKTFFLLFLATPHGMGDFSSLTRD